MAVRIVQQLVLFLSGCAETLKLPQTCKRKEVLAKSLSECASRMGNRAVTCLAIASQFCINTACEVQRKQLYRVDGCSCCGTIDGRLVTSEYWCYEASCTFS